MNEDEDKPTPADGQLIWVVGLHHVDAWPVDIEKLFMNTQHTPGPWTANRRYVETKDQTICEIFGGNREDARLIAAAPDLLGALKAMLTHMGMDEDEWNKPTFAQARAAIAKATGENT